MSDVVTSWLRTVVPGLYSTAITALFTWAAVEVPWLIDLLAALHIDPLAPATVLAVVALTLAAWHALWRKVEPSLPDWFTRVVLGSSRAPTYARVTADGVHVITDLSPEERRLVADLRAIEDDSNR